MAERHFGYICLAGDGQGKDWRLQVMRDSGVTDGNIFIDTDPFSRMSYQRLLTELSPRDVVFLVAANELGINEQAVRKEWYFIRENKQAHIVILGDPPVDTRNNAGISGTMYADIALAVVATMMRTEERLSLREQDAMRLAKARVKGNKPGRSPMSRPEELDILREQWQSGTLSARGAARLLGVSHHTALKWLRG